MHRKLVVAATAAAVLGVPAMAHASTQTVFMGEPANQVKNFENKQGADANQFFPKIVSVHVGDTVSFVPSGFHTIDFPKMGGKPSGLLAPTGTTAAEKDAAGNPFFFDGQPDLGFAPSMVKLKFGKTQVFTGAREVLSGLPLTNKPKPAAVKFSKAGTFTYYCNLHAGMVGTVKVVPKGKPASTPASIAASVKKQVAAGLAIAKALHATKAPANTVIVGPEKGGIAEYAFAPDKLSVKAGTTVTFTMATKATEVHSATAGPGDPEKQPKSYLGALAASIQTGRFSSQAVYPSDPGVVSITPTLHGNGFWNSGLLDQEPATPLPSSNKVTFSTPGTYTFYCMIHPFMKGQVVVG